MRHNDTADPKIERGALDQSLFMHDPIEFLFGNLPRQNEEPSNIHIPRKSPRSLPLLLLLMLYIIYVALSSYSVLYFDFSTSTGMLLALVLFSILLASSKNILLIRNYGPDLLHPAMKVRRFALLQVILSYILIGCFLGIIGVIGVYISNLEFSPIFMVFYGAIFIILYAKIGNDLALATLGTGTGLVSNLGGIRAVIKNFQQLLHFQGQYSLQLGLSRLLLWIFVFTGVYYQYYWFVCIYIPLFLLLATGWEKSNASSLLLGIRGSLHLQAPVRLPYISEKTSELRSSVKVDRSIYPQIRSSENVTYQDLLHGKKKTSHSIFSSNNRSSRVKDLAPVAARTINRIAQSIKDEEVQLPSNLMFYCDTCDIQLDQTGPFCQQCGQEVVLFNR
ncbi:MAG: hypothetical protein ACXAB7_16720 [Candidatus Kariarchaeaceae archaeon]|jgi:hypothetical protein